jgi:hypothetical protein
VSEQTKKYTWKELKEINPGFLDDIELVFHVNAPYMFALEQKIKELEKEITMHLDLIKEFHENWDNEYDGEPISKWLYEWLEKTREINLDQKHLKSGLIK